MHLKIHQEGVSNVKYSYHNIIKIKILKKGNGKIYKYTEIKQHTLDNQGGKEEIKREIRKYLGTSLVIQWVKLHTRNAGGLGSISDQGTRSPHACCN